MATKTTTVNLTGVHSIVLDEALLGSKSLQLRIYNAAGAALMVIAISTDQVTPNILTITNPYVPPPPPPPPVSPDGTKSAAPSGASLTTGAGLWAWSAAAVGRAGEYHITLNGAPNVGVGLLMEVANGGQLYVETEGSGGWFLWQNSAFVASAGPVTAAPPPPPPPPPPPTPPPLPTPTITLSPPPPIPNIVDSSPAGTLIATATVTMSDGSPFVGTLTSSNPSFMAVSGMKLVLARALSSADDGTKNLMITATTTAGVSAVMRLN